MIDRKTYMKEVYSKYWIDAREKKYGFPDYDKNVCSLLVNLAGDVKEKKFLEVAIGTGYPFAFYFNSVAEVYGIDLSPDLVAKCKEAYPNVRCEVGDAEKLPYQDCSFDIAYCFHSSWYFPNLKKAIDEMIRVTKNVSFIAFDIQNRNNPEIARGFKKNIAETRGTGKIKKVIKNLIKIAIGRGTPSWHFIVYETPSYPEDIYKMLKENSRVSSYNLYGRTDNDALKLLPSSSAFPEYSRLVFVAHIG
jgi:SAM-dependent methyltransferase